MILMPVAVALLDWVLFHKIIGIKLIVDQGFGIQPVSPALIIVSPARP